MRVVEREQVKDPLAMQVLHGVGTVSGLLALVVCILIIANNLTLKKADPIHAPALQTLLTQLKDNPENEVLKEEIRELDFLARQAYFTSQRFNRLAIYVLLGSLIVMLVAFKSRKSFQHTPPYPNAQDPKDDLPSQAHWARNSVAAVGLILVGLALALALPWQSPLDSATEPPAPALSSPDQATPPPPEPPSFPSREEQLAQWPTFLGAATGHAPNANPPLQWDGESGQGIAWKQVVPLPGFSSPIIWDDRVFLSGASASAREIYCFDTLQGNLLWKAQVKDIPGSPSDPPEVNGDTGFAASTMATDGRRVCAIFANGDLAAYDMEGAPLWSKSLGMPANHYGHASSLALHQDILLIQFDQTENSFLMGLDVATGRERWKTPRDFGPSWASPILAQINGQSQVLLAANPVVNAYDPVTGRELWKVHCLPRAEIGASPVHAEGRVFAGADYDKFAALDVQSQSILWQEEDYIPGVSTPVVSGELVFGGLADGGIVCFEAATGKVVWLQETDEGFYASPIVAGDRVYLMDRSGVMHIFAASREFHSLGQPLLGESAVCTPAVIGPHIYYRGTQHLFKIGS